jgi:hypothetical protein
MREGTADVPHQIAAAHLPEAASVCDAAAAPDTTLAMLDPQPTLVELLGRHVLLPHALLLQIEINSRGVGKSERRSVMERIRVATSPDAQAG